MLTASTEPGAVPPHEQHLSDQLDRLRDGAKARDPTTNLQLFSSFLDSLPADASATIRFRAKANVGLQHFANGDKDEAVRWLFEACDEAPDDRRAVANRTLALWLSGDAEEAYRYGREKLAADPGNEGLAQYLPQFALMVPSVTDGLEGIPKALLDREAVIVGQAVFLRGRDMRPAWWEWVESAAQRFPTSGELKVLVALSHVDMIARDEAAQRTQIFTPEQQERLVAAAAVLDADWQSRPWLLKNAFDDAAHSLANAMIAHWLAHHGETALARAERIADEGLVHPDILLNAVMIANAFGRYDLTKRLIALAPDDPDLAFHAGVIALGEDDWLEAVALFERATIPNSEKRVTETAIALTPIKEAGRPVDGSTADAAPLQALIEATRDSPRGLILIAQVASHLGLNEVAANAFEAAVMAVPEDCHLATRLMVARYAERAQSPTTVIRLLDGHLPSDGFEREYEGLAIAHANERPHRPRNLAFFDAMPAALRRLHGIARAHASVLLDIGRIPQAVTLLRRLHAEDQTDAFVTLQLVEALRRLDDEPGASLVLRRLELSQSRGTPEHLMALSQVMMRDGSPQRAYPFAYELVRRHSGNANVVLGYAGLGLLWNAPHSMFAMSVAGTGAYVCAQAPDGTLQNFVIDEGGDFFGIRVLSPTSGIAALVKGLRRGETFDLPKLGMDPETWTITEVASKYLHLHHRVLEEFETRFPNKPGIARFTVGEDDVATALEVVRRSAEQNAKNARVYMEMAVPLAIVARGLGGDVVSFAQYVRRLGGHIVTCMGSEEERVRGIDLARQYRGKGAVLDPYTAWVAAEIGVLPALRAWFGKLRTPASTMVMIERMIDREEDGRGREQMTLSWHNGQFFRTEVTEEFRDSQIAALKRIKDAITAYSEIAEVLAPNEISEPAELLLGMGGSRMLDASFLALETDTVLLSDDLRYRAISSEVVGCRGTWLQAVLLAACEARQISASEYASAVVGLAEHAHDHIALTGPLLYWIARQDREDLRGLRAALRFLAGPKAEMRSHRRVFLEFLKVLWPPDDVLNPLKTEAATGVALEAYLAHRKQDYVPLLNDVISRNRNVFGLSEYLASWLFGHFITDGDLAPAPTETAVTRRRRKRRK